jgi:hypothetical protein
MTQVVNAEGFLADLVRIAFWAIIAVFLLAMNLPMFVFEDGTSMRGWAAARNMLTVPLLFPSNFAFFVSAVLVAFGRYLGGTIAAAIATLFMFMALFVNPRGGFGDWDGSFGTGFYVWIASGILLTIFAGVLYLTQRD